MWECPQGPDDQCVAVLQARIHLSGTDRALQSARCTIHRRARSAGGIFFENVFINDTVWAGIVRDAALTVLQIDTNNKFLVLRDGRGEIGMKFPQVADSTATVHRSDRRVGSVEHGGSWELDRHAAPRPPFSDDALERFKRLSHNVAPFSGSVSEIISALTGGDGTSWGYGTQVRVCGILQCDRFRGRDSEIGLLAEANSSSVYGDSSVTLDDLGTDQWTVTSDPSDPSAENIAILEALDSSYACTWGGPITSSRRRRDTRRPDAGLQRGVITFRRMPRSLSRTPRTRFSRSSSATTRTSTLVADADVLISDGGHRSARARHVAGD